MLPLIYLYKEFLRAPSRALLVSGNCIYRNWIDLSVMLCCLKAGQCLPKYATEVRSKPCREEETVGLSVRVKSKGIFILHLEHERSLVLARATVVPISAFPERRLALTRVCHLAGSGEYCATFCWGGGFLRYDVQTLC